MKPKTATNQKKDSVVQIYDKIFKRILTLSNVAVINFVNGIFGKNFPTDSKLTYNWTENVKNSLEKTIADTIITVSPSAGRGGNTEKFHVEVQINSDSTIVLRVFDYGYQDALKYKKVEGDKIILDFPQSKVIFLEHNTNTPDRVILELNFKEQGAFEYNIPVMKFLSYSIDELNDQHLVILLPLYLLKLRREIEKEQSHENAMKLKLLINDGIIKSIEDNEQAGHITHDDTVILIGLLEKLYNHLYGGIKKFKEEGVKEMIAEKLILETDRIIYESEKREEKKALEGALEGALEKALEIAKKMLDSGMTVEQIQNLTELPLSKIKGLKKQK